MQIKFLVEGVLLKRQISVDEEMACVSNTKDDHEPTQGRTKDIFCGGGQLEEYFFVTELSLDHRETPFYT